MELNRNMKKKSIKAFGLAEILIALAIFGVVMIAAIALNVRSLSTIKDNELSDLANSVMVRSVEYSKTPDFSLLVEQTQGVTKTAFAITGDLSNVNTSTLTLVQRTDVQKITTCDASSQFKVQISNTPNFDLCNQIIVEDVGNGNYSVTSVVVYKTSRSTQRSEITTFTAGSLAVTFTALPTATFTPSPSNSPTPTRTNTPTPTATNTPTPTPTVSKFYYSQPFDSMPSWDSTTDERWGFGPYSPDQGIGSGGYSGTTYYMERSCGQPCLGSSTRVLRMNIPANKSFTISVYVRSSSGPGYNYSYGGDVWWASTAYKMNTSTSGLGSGNCDSSDSSWTRIQSFSSSSNNGNGNIWTQYSRTFSSGSNTFLSVCFKLGHQWWENSSSPRVRWDELVIQEL